MFDFNARRVALSSKLLEVEIDAVFLPLGSDFEYFTGIRRNLPTYGATSYTHGWATGVFLSPHRDPIFLLPRLVALVHFGGREVPGDLIRLDETGDGEYLFNSALKKLGKVRRVAVAHHTWAANIIRLRSYLPDAEILDIGPITNEMRAVKSHLELESMRKACEIVDKALLTTFKRIAEGVTARELSQETDYQMRLHGSEGPSFNTFVGTYGLENRRDSLSPKTADLPIRMGEAIKWDFGAVVNGYCSDFGRTAFLGEPSNDYLAAYQVLLAAQLAGIKAAKPGARAGDVDLACRQVIEDAGFAEYFIHRTGHCIGLDVHERPFISEEDDMALQTGMTFTIEPSINKQGHFGMRIEDIVVCSPDGSYKLNDCCEVLHIV